MTDKCRTSCKMQDKLLLESINRLSKYRLINKPLSKAEVTNFFNEINELNQIMDPDEIIDYYITHKNRTALTVFMAMIVNGAKYTINKKGIFIKPNSQHLLDKVISYYDQVADDRAGCGCSFTMKDEKKETSSRGYRSPSFNNFKRISSRGRSPKSKSLYKLSQDDTASCGCSWTSKENYEGVKKALAKMANE